MSVDHTDFERLASISAGGKSEIDWRNSVSRAYYAAFHIAQQHVHHCPDNAHLQMGTHARLSDRFASEKSTAGRAISYILVAMKRSRHLADYEISDPFTQDLATKQLAQLPLLRGRLQAFSGKFGAPPPAFGASA
nr:hypothetical protein [Cupriavidus gilardii]